MYIPFIKIPYEEEYITGLKDVFESGMYVEGEYTREFEELFAKYVEVKYSVAVNNGTSAEYLILKALGIGPGDKVVVPSFTFISTVSQVMHLGAKPVFVDVDLDTYTIDIEDLKNKVDGSVKAVIAVHLFGHPADLKPILELADKYGFYVIEDACQAHGSRYMNKHVGGFGYAGFFSFYPTKNMTVYGEGGMIVSNDEGIIDKIRLLKNHGITENGDIITLGYNMNFNEIQAYLGIKSLLKLDDYVKRRREIAKMYNEELSGYVDTPIEKEYAYHSYSLYSIKSRDRDKLLKFLRESGIDVRIYYKKPLHRQPIIKRILGEIKLENTEKLSKIILSLPIYPSLSDAEISYIINKVKEFHSM
ncbi:erythromycin biosynthesis sensory transduction protein eryC1 [Candidatus Geothermarchaeota archaeon]|nr:MAG: erythromycin biosynthesis sensory transduction protein eryC1 [Candidatus Geothermarchaeota archaeon]RLG61877.1 MAG: erythromycin biosynthesis sensory transduction protein eryC1 [Candidatus Geothermarchaeota archaeon]HEW93787.1 DegT/DnrJ/EryC1/StrS family aminotransferase [Thermoprotei archaeon]